MKGYWLEIKGGHLGNGVTLLGFLIWRLTLGTFGRFL